MNVNSRKWAKFTLRWGIAVLGIAWVLAKTSFHDHVLILDRSLDKQQVRVEDGAPNSAPEFWAFYGGRRQYPISRDRIWTPEGDRRTVPIAGPGGAKVQAKVLAVHPALDQQPKQPPAELLIEDPATRVHRIIKPSDVIGGYTLRVVYPLIDIGILRLVREARP